MRLDSVFNITYGQSLALNALTQVEAPEGVNFISRTGKNNGVSARVEVPENVEPSPGGCLTVALGGSVLATFYQPEPFVCGRDVAVLMPKNPDMSLSERLWWCAVVNANADRYSFGRQANKTLGSLRVPNKVPPFVSRVTLEDVLKEHDEKVLEGSESAEDYHPLPDLATWQPFTIGELFDVKRGGNETPGTEVVPYVTSSARNNGVTDYRKLKATSPAGTITVACDGSIGSSFYQPKPYASSSHVCILTPNEGVELTPENALFVCAVIQQEAFKYNFGRAWRMELMRSTVIKLPAVVTGDEPPVPDGDTMTRYIQGLPYSAAVGKAVVQPAVAETG